MLMTKVATKPNTKSEVLSPYIKKGKERLKAFDALQGMWKHRKPDPIKELNKIRKGWDRKLL